jgi:putative acyl-CoA dehydrogenase
VPEAQARILARDVALVMQAALLQRQSPAAVFDAFCASRLQGAPDVFGLLDERVDLDPLIERARPVEHA